MPLFINEGDKIRIDTRTGEDVYKRQVRILTEQVALNEEKVEREKLDL